MKRGARDRERILIVDDDDLVRWSATEGLRDCGYQVEVAPSTREALEHCPGAAVALLDHDHPRVDGLALADLLRRQCPRCAVVLMAADITPDLHRRAGERGIACVLAKPFSLEDLVETIGDALGRGHPSCSNHSARGRDDVTESRETGPPRGV